MKRSLLSCVALVAAFAAAGAAALAQPPERRQDAYGKLTKLTQTEIDLAILDDQGHSKTQIFTVARYARCGPAKIGAMVVVHFFTDAKGGMSTITTADVFQSNGVIHVVDTVLMPS